MQQRSTIPPSTLDLYNALSAEVPHNGAAHPPGGLLVLCGEVVFADRSPYAVKSVERFAAGVQRLTLAAPEAFGSRIRSSYTVSWEVPRLDAHFIERDGQGKSGQSR